MDKYSISLNQKFENSRFHHLWLNGDAKIGIYIPTELHLKYPHKGNNHERLKKINKAALEWLCNQDIIIGDTSNQKSLDEPEKGIKALVNYSRVKTVHEKYISRIVMNDSFSSILEFEDSALLEAYYDKEKRQLIIREQKQAE